METVHQEERSYDQVPIVVNRRCDQCFDSTWPDRKFLCCSGCNSAYYCSERCQSQDWGHHRPDCNPPTSRKIDRAMKKEYPPISTSAFESMVRFYLPEIQDTAALNPQEGVSFTQLIPEEENRRHLVRMKLRRVSDDLVNGLLVILHDPDDFVMVSIRSEKMLHMVIPSITNKVSPFKHVTIEAPRDRWIFFLITYLLQHRIPISLDTLERCKETANKRHRSSLQILLQGEDSNYYIRLTERLSDRNENTESSEHDEKKETLPVENKESGTVNNQ